MNKILIPIIIALTIAAGIGAFFAFQKSAFPKSLKEKIERDFFFEVHLEPQNADSAEFNNLVEFIALADKYGIKLTILLTPPWVDVLLSDSKKAVLLDKWRQNGHEIGGHHHGPTVCPWDGYTNLDIKSDEFKSRQKRIPCPERAQEKYLGNMTDYIKVVSKIGEIKTITMSDEDVDWPSENIYSAGGLRLDEAISLPGIVERNRKKIYKISSAPMLPKQDQPNVLTTIAGPFTLDDLKNKYISKKEGVFGVATHPKDYKKNPALFEEWFIFLKNQNTKPKTVSQILDEFKDTKSISDTTSIAPKHSEEVINNDSPFGMHPAHIQVTPPAAAQYNEALDMGAKWHRPSLYAFWSEVQKNLNVQNYNFSKYDLYYGAVPKEISILGNIAPSNPRRSSGYMLTNSFVPVDEQKYKNFVKVLVERYDGDGRDDMPNLKNPILYWQVGNEPNDRGGIKDFAKLQKITYSAIKEACPGCKVLIGGAAQPVRLESDFNFVFDKEEYFSRFKDEYEPIIAQLDGEGFDIFDFHWYGSASGDYKKIKPILDELKSRLKKYGYADIPIWVTEMGAYSGAPADKNSKGEKIFPYQTESQQAADYLKRFIYSLSIGIEKIFPAFGLIEGFRGDDRYFDHTGFIYDGKYSNDPGYGVKKLSYYTYKKMTEILEGSDWNNIQKVQEKDGVYVYKFIKNGKPIWVGWNDNSAEKTIEITGIGSKEVKITEAVPRYESGKEVTNYNTAFETETKTPTGGKISVALQDKPVFIEEK